MGNFDEQGRDLRRDADELKEVALVALKTLYKNQLTIAEALKVCRDNEDWHAVVGMINKQIAQALDNIDRICPPAPAQPIRQQDNLTAVPGTRRTRRGVGHHDESEDHLTQ